MAASFDHGVPVVVSRVHRRTPLLQTLDSGARL